MMTTRYLVLLAALLSACSRPEPAGPSAPNATRFANAEVEIVGVGGLGGFMTTSRVRRTGPDFLQTRHRICSVPQCQAALDSATGELNAEKANALFAEIDASDPFALRDDYGITRGAADMITYTMRVTIGGRTKTVQADDGTMPPAMRKIDSALRATIDAARR
jgi:hypothetical protein